jgi:hypothetical protein
MRGVQTMFRPKPDPKPEYNITHAPVALDEINSFSLQNKLKVTDVVICLEHKRYREETKSNLQFKINGDDVWALSMNHIWMAFTRENKNICIEWVALISKFRR